MRIVMTITVVYTDGACLGNPGPGGWGWYVPATGESDSGAERNTTNNRMELVAVMEALTCLAQAGAEDELHIYSDSKYIVDCFNQGWWEKWESNGWKTANKQPVKNQDLWDELIDLVYPDSDGDRVKFFWVKGHSGDPGNEEADRLAMEAAQNLKGRA